MTIQDILQYRRPHGSKTEKQFIVKFIDSVNGMKSDKFGNRMITVGDNPNKILFSCHTDTVHKKGGLQKICFDDFSGYITVDDKDSNCLGADDGSGIFIMLKMIEANISGLYVFHRGEECGGLGSKYIATKTPELLDDIDIAIAFDRKGYDNTITHQFNRCCSDAFAKELSNRIGSYTPDDTGVFTDTANYTELVPECTNISVGYFDQHTTAETQDAFFLVELTEKLIALDWSNLPVKRDPSAIDYDYKGYSYKSFNSQSVSRPSLYATYDEIADYCYYDYEDAAQFIIELREKNETLNSTINDIASYLQMNGIYLDDVM